MKIAHIYKIILFSYLMVISLDLQAAELLDGAALLNKVSHSLRGVMASIEDQKALNKLKDADARKQFISGKVNEYLKSVEYTNKMTFRLEELFKLRPAKMANADLQIKDEERTASATNYLSDSMTLENRSWDDLLVSKKYRLNERVKSEFGETISDFGFFGNVLDLPAVTSGYIKNLSDLADETEVTRKLVTFDDADVRMAGVITTPRFFARYGTTGINKNRGRAAALFRIFLCDSMTASIPKIDGISDQLYNMLYPDTAKNSGMTEVEIRSVLNRKDSIHGNRSDCRSCHYKLDPMGSVFKFSAASLSSMPSEGALVYKNKAGTTINVPVAGIGQLASAIVQQPEYVSCQIRTLWNWYIGQDKLISPEKMQELEIAFNKVGRRTNDFVKYLLSQREYSEREEPNELRDLARNTKRYLQRCQSCHNEASDYFGTDLLHWPLGSKDKAGPTPAHWLAGISKALDLDHGGLNRKMPPSPKDGGFIPTRQELEMLKLWIQKGAPDETGKLQVNP